MRVRIVLLNVVIGIAVTFGGAFEAAAEDRYPAEIVPQLGHSASVFSVSVSTDWRFVLSASDDKTLKLWELATGRLIRTFWDCGRAAIFLPDRRSALTTSGDGKTLKLLDLATGREIRTFSGHSASVSSVAISPDGRYALSGSEDHTLKLWDLATGHEVRTFSGHSESVSSVAISPDGRYALSGSEDRTLKLWDLASGSLLRTLTGHSGWVQSVIFAPDGKQALSGSSDGTIKLWDLASGRLIRTLKDRVPSPVYSVAIAPDGKTAISSDLDAPKLWDLVSGREIRTLDELSGAVPGHSVAVAKISLSPEGKTVLIGSHDYTPIIWDLASRRAIREFSGRSETPASVALVLEGKSALSDHGRALYLWDMASGRKIWTISEDGLLKAVSPDGKTALTDAGAGDPLEFKLWDLATGKLIRSFGKAEVMSLQRLSQPAARLP
jgi:WD40 repeat protein